MTIAKESKCTSLTTNPSQALWDLSKIGLEKVGDRSQTHQTTSQESRPCSTNQVEHDMPQGNCVKGVSLIKEEVSTWRLLQVWHCRLLGTPNPLATLLGLKNIKVGIIWCFDQYDVIPRWILLTNFQVHIAQNHTWRPLHQLDEEPSQSFQDNWRQ